MKELIYKTLREYVCTYSKDNDGYGIELVDLLSPGSNIYEGARELELIADELSYKIDEIMKKVFRKIHAIEHIRNNPNDLSNTELVKNGMNILVELFRSFKEDQGKKNDTTGKD